MQLSDNFVALAFAILSSAIASVSATPAPIADVGPAEVNTAEPATYLMSHEEMAHWLATTDAELTFIGEPINPLTPREALDTTVTYCNTRAVNVCGGACTVYTGNAACLNAPGTNCLAATTNVAFCDRAGCGHSCNQLSTCGTHLDNGFCYTPGTASILVPST